MAEERHPGNSLPLESEIERLRWLRDTMWSSAETVKSLHSDAWAGPAHDAFHDFSRRLAARWRHIGDQCEHAASLLADYRATAEELRAREPWHIAPGQLLGEMTGAAARASTKLREITAQLDQLRRLIDDAVESPAAALMQQADAVEPGVTPPTNAEPAGRRDAETPSRTVSPPPAMAIQELYLRDVNALNAQLLAARIEQLPI